MTDAKANNKANTKPLEVKKAVMELFKKIKKELADRNETKTVEIEGKKVDNETRVMNSVWMWIWTNDPLYNSCISLSGVDLPCEISRIIRCSVATV